MIASHRHMSFCRTRFQAPCSKMHELAERRSQSGLRCIPPSVIELNEHDEAGFAAHAASAIKPTATARTGCSRAANMIHTPPTRANGSDSIHDRRSASGGRCAYRSAR